MKGEGGLIVTRYVHDKLRLEMKGTEKRGTYGYAEQWSPSLPSMESSGFTEDGGGEYEMKRSELMRGSANIRMEGERVSNMQVHM